MGDRTADADRALPARDELPMEPGHLCSWRRDRESWAELDELREAGWLVASTHPTTGVVWLFLPVRLCPGTFEGCDHG